MKTVITGATGFIGRVLTARLLQENHSVVALTRDVVRARAVLGPSVRCLDWQGGSDDAWKTEVRTADAVFHLAGESVAAERWTPEYKTRVLESRTETTRMLVDAQPGGVFVCASAVGYYGGRGDDVITETDAPGDDFLAEVCVAWEREANRASELPGVRVAIPRIGIVFGRNGGPLQSILRPPGSPVPLYKWGLGGPLGDGKQWVPWVHLHDLVGMLVWAATNTAVRGVFNAVAPNPVTSTDLAHAIGAFYGKPAILPVPEFALKAALGEFADALLYSQRVAPTVLQANNFPFRFGEVDAALRDLLS
ncbi:MAG: TIGR01777 family protein [Akkermansiaceae bacterium]|nr:TIGR01777 family protein [Armatimonadota bacterium]